MSYPHNIASRGRLQLTRSGGQNVILGSDAYDIAIESNLVNVREAPSGLMTVDFNVGSLRATTGTSLYVSHRGSNSNTGLSWAQAYRSIWKAIISMDTGSAYGASTIYVAAGTYDYTNGFAGLGPGNDSFNLIAVGGRVRSTTSRLNLSWSLVGGGTPDVYSASLSTAPYAVVDELYTGTYGLASRLTLQASAAAVQSNPGSYYHTGSTLYVRTVDSRAPDLYLHPFEGGGSQYNMLINNAAVVAYVEGVDFLGGEKAAYMLNGTRLTLVDCDAHYANSEGVRTEIADAYMVRVRSQENGGDGFAYTYTTGAGTSRAVEFLCVGSDNGYGADETSNGSSMHSGGAVIRVGGTYQRNKGPNIADVNDSRSWNHDLTVGLTRASTASQRTNFYCDGQMFIGGCTLDATGMAYDIQAEDAEDVVEVASDTTYGTTGGSGTVSAY